MQLMPLSEMNLMLMLMPTLLPLMLMQPLAMDVVPLQIMLLAGLLLLVLPKQ
jgi:hypothetical protein